jgi:regulator of sigma E protease
MTWLASVWQWTVIIAEIIIFLGLSIFVHELGHFLVARKCGFVIDTFSIGFGPALWKKKVNGTVYKIGLIPCGGYVALPQLDPSGMELIQGRPEDDSNGSQPAGAARRPRNLPPISPWKRILVSFAGVVGNMIFAVVIAWFVYWRGIPSVAAFHSGQIGYVEQGSDADQQGLRPGDVVVGINGKKVQSWKTVLIEATFADEVVLEVVSAASGLTNTVTLKTIEGELNQKSLVSIRGIESCEVASVAEGSSAATAGIQAKDLILDVNGIPICGHEHLQRVVNDHRDMLIPVRIKRGDAIIEKMVTPVYNADAGRAMMGIALGYSSEIRHPKPGEQIKEHAMLIFRMLGALGSKKEAGNAMRAVGGPVLILKTYVTLFATSFMLAVWFTGLLNVNLAILNLLPIPILDGGHIGFALWEGISGKPAHPKVVSALFNVFGALIIALLIAILVHDVVRVVPKNSLAGRAIDSVGRVFDHDDAVDAATNGTAKSAVSP